MAATTGRTRVASSGSEGAKAFGGIAAMFAIMASIAALARPMNQKIDMVDDRQDRQEARMESDDVRERMDASERSNLAANDRSHDLQLGAIGEVLDVMRDWILNETAASADHGARIKSLERAVYKGDE